MSFKAQRKRGKKWGKVSASAAFVRRNVVVVAGLESTEPVGGLSDTTVRDEGYLSAGSWDKNI